MTTGASGPAKAGRLLRIRDWLTVAETARYLALIFEDDVTEADVLRLGLDGHLKLSVRFVNHAIAKRHRELADAEIGEGRGRLEQLTAECREAAAAGLPFPTKVLTAEEEEIQREDRRIYTLGDGIYDLPMIGAERLDVEHEYQQQTNGPEVTLINMFGAFVDSEDGIRFVLQEKLPATTVAAGGVLVKADPYYPPSGLPDDSVLVVRTAALRELEARVSGDATEPPSNVVGKPLKERERTTLLTIIAALAKAAKIDVEKSSKAGAAIEALTTAMGARVSARAVEDHLKRIPDALERRGDTSA